jgi:hypothetical protein
MAETDDPAEAASRVHFANDNGRISALAEAMFQQRTGRSAASWQNMALDDQRPLRMEARNWLRAAVAAGLLPGPGIAADEELLLSALTPEQCDGTSCFRCGGVITVQKPDERHIVLAGRQMFVHVDPAVCERYKTEHQAAKETKADELGNDS